MQIERKALLLSMKEAHEFLRKSHIKRDWAHRTISNINHGQVKIPLVSFGRRAQLMIINFKPGVGTPVGA